MDGGNRNGKQVAHLEGIRLMNTREWLLENGYPDIVELIDKVMLQWKEKGANTRRNWWETLAGRKNGRPTTINGIEFPVLVIAQIYQGVPVTPNAIQRSPYEKLPEKVYHGRSLTRLRKKADGNDTP